MRRGLFWLHLGAGVVAGLVILVLCATGTLLTYQRQITRWADRMPAVEPPAGTNARAPIADVVEAAAATREGAPATSVMLRSDPRSPATVTFGRDTVVFVDPYRAAVVGEGSVRARALFRALVEWHRWLALPGPSRETGRALIGAANLVFLFIVLSGVYLWWPRRWTRAGVSAVTVPSLGLRGRARDFNWHNAVGFWSALPLAIVVICGAVISYPWASDLVYRLCGDEPPARASRPAGTEAAHRDRAARLDGADVLAAAAAQRMPGWNTLTLRLPLPASGAVPIAIDRGEGARPDLRAQLSLDRATGAELKWEPYESQSRGRRVRSWMRWLHTGEAAGVLGQTIAGLASAGGVILGVTGLALACRRLAAWRLRSRGPISPSPLAVHPSIHPGGIQ